MVDEMPRYLSIYRLFVANQIRTLMIHRADFIVGVVCLLLSFVAIRFSVWAIFERTQNIGGWVKGEILFMYGYNLVAAGIAWFFFNQAWGLRDTIVSGGFLRYKIRPINPLFHFFAESMDIRSLVTIFLGVVTIRGASVAIDYTWDAASVAEMLALVALSATLLGGLIVLMSGLAFWVTISNPLLSLLSGVYGIAHFPVGIYGNPMQLFLSTVVPIAFLSFYPCSLLLGKIDTATPVFVMVAMIVGIWIAGAALWRVGVQRYELSGT
jgi:ABC-2 type transport system permease protein